LSEERRRKPEMVPFFDKIADKLVPAASGAVAAALITLGLVTAQDQRIDNIEATTIFRFGLLEKSVDDLGKLEILPEASLRVGQLEHDFRSHEKRLNALELFKTEGRRCTRDDCERIEEQLIKVADAQTQCLTSVAVTLQRIAGIDMDIVDIEEEIQELAKGVKR